MFKIIYNNIVLLIIFVVVMLVVSCDTVSRTEVTRIKSPDSIADAVLIKVNAGATASYAYEVYIIPTGGQPTQGNEIFKADKINGLEIQWIQSKYLEIKYDDGRIFHFSNFWHSKDVDNFRYIVDIELSKKIKERQNVSDKR
ncbi:MAG TPA: hypothetical protein PKI97_04145 [Smithellaceae bacterium]|nr:hypothetical protein [Smithellaceae bacterium]